MMWSYSSSSTSSSVSWRITMAEIERQQRMMLEQHNPDANHSMVEIPFDDEVCATASTSSMVDATAVGGTQHPDDDINDNDNHHLVKDHSRDCLWPSWPLELLAVLSVLIFGAVAITLIVLNSKHSNIRPTTLPFNNNNNNNTGANSTSPTPVPAPTAFMGPPPNINRAKFRKQIQSILRITNRQLANHHSPTFQAFQWIVYQDNLVYKVTDFQLIQRFALVALHYSTGYWNPYVGGWGRITGTRTQECDWIGIDCDAQSRVRAIELPANLAPTKLTGGIPNEIHWLQQLRSLVLHDNEMTGQLPSGLFSLRNLGNLDLSANKMNTTISPFVANLTNLAGLDLRNNSIVGTLPSELGTLKTLQHLLLSGNPRLSGTIPSEMGALTMLQILELDQTDLKGTMPRSVCNLVAVGQLSEITATCGVTKLNCTCCSRCE